MFHVVVTIPAPHSSDPIVESHQTREEAASRVFLAEGVGFTAASFEVSWDGQDLSVREIVRTSGSPSETRRSMEFEARQLVLRRAFDVVADREHWKGRVNRILDTDQIREAGGAELIAFAVAEFTATECLRIPARTVSGAPLVHFLADGYWAGPAA